MSLRIFGGLSNGAITAILIMLSVLMALLLVFFTLELAKDMAEENEKEEDEERNVAERNESNPTPHIEILPVYAPRVEEVEVQEAQVIEEIAQEVVEVPQVVETPQVIEQVENTDSTAGEDTNGAAQVLREGIAFVMPEEDETGEMGVRYDRSFTAKLIQSSDEVKEWYSEIKNYLLSYKKVHARMSWGKESFRIGKDCFARFVIKGKTLCIMLAIIPDSCLDTKYKTEDFADLTSCKDTPCLYRIKSNRRVSYAKELIEIILQEYDAKRYQNAEAVDYYLPYEGTVDLIKRGLIKRKIVAKRDDFLAHLSSPDDDGNVGVA